MLKMRLLQAPILSFLNFSYPFVIDTDASEIPLGAILSQAIEGEERPMAFDSRVLTKTEMKLCHKNEKLWELCRQSSGSDPISTRRNVLLEQIMRLYNDCSDRTRME